MRRLGIIYCATNVTNGMVYVGQTNNYAKRIKEHIRYSYQKHRREYHTKFHEAIRTHGYGNFKWSILYMGVPESYIDIMEEWVIQNFNSLESGYNAHRGGRTVNTKLTASVE